MIAIRTITTALRRTISKELTRACADMDRRLSEAIGLSESEVMAATQSLVKINQEAKEHVADLQRIAAQLGGERRIASAMIENQTRYCAMAVSHLRRQQEVAERSVSLTRAISDFVGTIGNISAAARILTINGQIESARLGSKGAAFSVIADQLRDLSTAVQNANESISSLAKDLSDQMPLVVESSALLLKETESFSDEQRGRIADFQVAVDDATRRLGVALAETRERAARMISRAGEILTHMQFHDRMAQDLREVTSVTTHAKEVITNVVDAVAELPAEADAALLGDGAVDKLLARAHEATPKVRHRLSQRAGASESTEGEPAAGEVLLF